MKAACVIPVVLLCATILRAQYSFDDVVMDSESCVSSCYYLSIEVESRAYSGRVVITSRNVFSFLKLRADLHGGDHRETARQLLENNMRLDLNEYEVRVNAGTALFIDGISENLFGIVPKIPEFEAVASRGCVDS